MTKPKPNPKPKPPRPVESFGPGLFAILLKAATTRIEYRMSYRRATNFRMRLHQLRHAMRLSSHEHYGLVSRVRITVRWPEGTPTLKADRNEVPRDRSTTCEVVLQPNDSEFDDLLAEAGIQLNLPLAYPIDDLDTDDPELDPDSDSEWESGLNHLLDDFDPPNSERGKK